MKVRNGFVSNSSSSSFICEICNRKETGFDCSALDLGFVYCENGHCFCDEHIIDAQSVNDENDEDYLSERHCPICNYKEISYSNIRAYFIKTTQYTIEEVFDEIKKINKRRKKVYDHEYVEYVLKALSMTSDELLEKLKVEYPLYKDLLCAIRY